MKFGILCCVLALLYVEHVGAQVSPLSPVSISPLSTISIGAVPVSPISISTLSVSPVSLSTIPVSPVVPVSPISISPVSPVPVITSLSPVEYLSPAPPAPTITDFSTASPFPSSLLAESSYFEVPTIDNSPIPSGTSNTPSLKVTPNPSFSMPSLSGSKSCIKNGFSCGTSLPPLSTNRPPTPLTISPGGASSASSVTISFNLLALIAFASILILFG